MPDINFQMKREIRPTIYQLETTTDKRTGDVVLIAIHPLDGESFVYVLDEDTRKRLKDGLGSGLVTATADQVPPPPQED